MFALAPLRTAASGLLDEAPALVDPDGSRADPSLVRARLQRAAHMATAREIAAEDLQAEKRRPYPRTPYYGVLSSVTVEVTRIPNHGGDPAVVHRRLEQCLAMHGSMYYCGTASSSMTASAEDPHHHHVSAVSASSGLQQQPLLYSKYIDAFCDAFQLLELKKETLKKEKHHTTLKRRGTGDLNNDSGDGGGGDDNVCSDVLYWLLEKHELYKDTRCMFFVENGAMCCFLHTSSSALRDHLERWFAKIKNEETLEWIDGGLLLVDREESAGDNISSVRVLFDLLLNLRLHGLGDVSSAVATTRGPVSLFQQSSGSTGSLVFSAAKHALQPTSMHIPAALHVSIAASFPFSFGEHRVPKLRAMKMIRRSGEQDKQQGASRTDVHHQEEIYTWVLVAVAGFYVLPPLLHRLVRCLQMELKLSEFVLHLVPAAVAAATSGRASKKLAGGATSVDATTAAAGKGMQILKKSGGGTAAAWNQLSQTSVPLLVFSRLSSEDWLDAEQRQLYAAADSDDCGDLEFYPSKIHFRRDELFSRPAQQPTLTRKRSRTPISDEPGKVDPVGDFAITTTVVYAPPVGGAGRGGGEEQE